MRYYILLTSLLFSLTALAQAIPENDASPTATDHAGQAVTATSYTATATSTNSAVMITQGAKLCLNGVTCTIYVQYDGTNLRLVGAEVTTPTGLVLSPTRDDTAMTYTAEATSGDVAFQVGNAGAKICLDPAEPNNCVYKNISSGVTYFPGGIESGAGQNNIFDSWYPKQTSLPPIINGSHGFRSLCVTGTLDTCDATLAAGGAEVNVCASTDGTSRTRKCQCASDGEASPTFAWITLTPGPVNPIGTTTSCPAVDPTP
jgi:hypothetical protein